MPKRHHAISFAVAIALSFAASAAWSYQATPDNTQPVPCQPTVGSTMIGVANGGGQWWAELNCGPLGVPNTPCEYCAYGYLNEYVPLGNPPVQLWLNNLPAPTGYSANCGGSSTASYNTNWTLPIYTYFWYHVNIYGDPCPAGGGTPFAEPLVQLVAVLYTN